MKHPTDFSTLSKISAGYSYGYHSDTGVLWSKSNQFEKSLKTAVFRSNPTAGYQEYQLDINRISMLFIYRI